MKAGTLFVALVVAGACIAGMIWISSGANPVEVGRTIQKAESEGLAIAETGPYPKVVLPETEYYFDVMAANSEKSHKFVIKNEGEAALKLKIKGTSCTCTLSDLAKDEIPVGEQAEVELKWTPRAPDPEFSKYAEVWTNDPEHKLVTFHIRGRVESTVSVVPEGGWTLQSLDRSKPEQLTAVIYSPILDQFSVNSVESSSKSLTVTYEPLSVERLKEVRAKSGYQFHVTLDPKDLKLGKIEESVKVNTDIKDAETVVFPISGQFLGSITGLPFVPDGKTKPAGMMWNLEVLQTSLGDVPASEGGEGWYKLVVGDMPEGQKFEVTDIESSMPEYVSAEVQELPTAPQSTRKHFLVTFRVKPGVPPGSYQSKESAKVILKTNHPQAPEIKFYVSFDAI